MGQPISAVKDWLRMTLHNNWVPQFFWKAVSKLFNVTKGGQTPYENIHIRIQRFGLILANKKKILEILGSQDSKSYTEFAQITGLAWHPQDNSPNLEKEYLMVMEVFLTKYYEAAKSESSDALMEYFRAFDGVCFEQRVKNIIDYIVLHPLIDSKKIISLKFTLSL